MIASVNPATGETLRAFPPLDDAQIEEKLARAQTAWLAYRHTSFADRARWLLAAADILETDRDGLGRIMTLEMGKPIGAARAEAAKCATACRYYAEHGERLLADEPVDAGAGRSFIRYQPLGPVLAVMPWNFPFWQVFRFAAPALMAGNVGLLKHASNVPQCALAIEDIIRRAGFPEDVFQTLLIAFRPGAAGDRRPARQRRHPHRQRSRPARRWPPAAGRQIKKTVLELGGSDPFVVMPGADLDRAARVGRRGPHHQQRPVLHRRQTLHRGRSASPPISNAVSSRPWKPCASATPWTKPRRSARWPRPRFSKIWTARCAAPSKWARAFSPAATAWIAPAITMRPPCSPMFRPPPPAYREELFGPVAVAAPRRWYRTTPSAWPTTPSSAWAPAPGPNDPAEQRRFIDEIEAGMVFINGMVASDAAPALWRRQTLRLRPRAQRLGHPRVRQHQNRPCRLTGLAPLARFPVPPD